MVSTLAAGVALLAAAGSLLTFASVKMPRNRWYYRAQRPKCWLGRHQWRRLDGNAWRVRNPVGPGHVLAVCKVCHKREVAP